MRGEVGLGRRHGKESISENCISHVTIATTHLPKCVYIVNTYIMIAIYNVQDTTLIKGNPYKCTEQYYKSLCFAAQTNFLLPPLPDPTIHVLEFTRGAHHNGTGSPPLISGHKGRV